ncbi:MAG TPA: EAL domain-containing protein [Rhodanobacteraceae bacterium]|nr:EAL domain-containing protein [Rhodanobacteraceae bacterium]
MTRAPEVDSQTSDSGPGAVVDSSPQLTRRLLPLAWALLALLALLLAVIWGVLQAQLVASGFLNSESIWSKAQKQAVIDLDAYAASGDPARLLDYRRSADLLASDRWARDALAGGDASQLEISAAFTRGNVMPAAKPGMIVALRHFATAPYLREALAQWRATDPLLDELQAIAGQLKAAYASGRVDTAVRDRMRARIGAINRAIEPLSNRFSVAVARGAEWLGRALFLTVLVVAVLAALLWLQLARRILGGIRNSEERFRLLFDSSADALVVVEQGTERILAVNRRAEEWSGRRGAELRLLRYERLFTGARPPTEQGASARLRSAHGSPRPVEMHSTEADWGEIPVRQVALRDVSERVASEQAQRVAAEALANIADGVIIADADRRVTAVNAAHVDISGYSGAMLAGKRFDDLRRMPNGERLPDAIWSAVAAGAHWRGEVQARHHDGGVYPELLSIGAIRGRDGRVQHYVATFSNIAEAKAHQRRLEYLAAHDGLTNLVNRAEFERLCDAAILAAKSSQSSLAVLVINLDAFKLVNDRYSHAIGDRVLKKLAERLERQLPEHGVAGRIGGDVFTVLAGQLTLREDVIALAQRVLTALATPVVLDEYEVRLSASVGIAAYPLDGDNAAQLIARADAAMGVAKSEERNAWRLYSPMLQNRMRRRLLLAADLRQALVSDQLRLVYQPSVELNSGRIVAVEALLRWDHPDRGEIPPGEFIPIAESLGVIRRIDEWVLRHACRQIRAWNRLDMPPIRVAVNVSASWFSHRAFVDGVRRNIEMHGIRPERLMLEVTEGTMLRLGDETERTLHALHDLGVGVAIDDFGTGYSSLAYLKLPAVACLKVDQSFVAGIPSSDKDVAITQAVLAMARSLGLYVIAEGIETEAQHDFLLRAGCSEGQGYLYSWPVSAAAIEHLLRPQGGDRSKARLQLVPPWRS